MVVGCMCIVESDNEETGDTEDEDGGSDCDSDDDNDFFLEANVRDDADLQAHFKARWEEIDLPQAPSHINSTAARGFAARTAQDRLHKQKLRVESMRGSANLFAFGFKTEPAKGEPMVPKVPQDAPVPLAAARHYTLEEALDALAKVTGADQSASAQEYAMKNELSPDDAALGQVNMMHAVRNYLFNIVKQNMGKMEASLDAVDRVFMTGSSSDGLKGRSYKARRIREIAKYFQENHALPPYRKGRHAKHVGVVMDEDVRLVIIEELKLLPKKDRSVRGFKEVMLLYVV